MDRWKEGYNDCDMEWRKKIEKEIKELEKYKSTDEVDEFGIHSMNWLVADSIQGILQSLLKKG
jgi:hypothetical protein